MTRPTSAKGTSPYPHRTVAEIDRAFGAIATLERLQMRRVLTASETSLLAYLRRVRA
jgi:hypothetical protein